MPPLVVALAVSIVCNFALVFLALHFRNYSRALVSDMELIGRLVRERREEATRHPSWLPTSRDTLPFDESHLDALNEAASELAGKRLGADAEVGFRWIGLSFSTASFWAESPSAQKGANIIVSAGHAPWISGAIERAVLPWMVGVLPTPWRQDHTWRPLLLDSWKIEEPYHGEVILFGPPYGPQRAPYRWTVQYMPVVNGVKGISRQYIWDGSRPQLVGRRARDY